MLNAGFHFTLHAEYFYFVAVQLLLKQNVWTFPQPHVVQTMIKLTETIWHGGRFSEGKNTWRFFLRRLNYKRYYIRILTLCANVGHFFCPYVCMYAHACLRHKPTRSRESTGVHVFHGVPEAPCVGPKYYTQTVAITSKPEIPHSTFLIPPARLLSWAPHEEPLLEREGSCISPSVCLSVSGSHSALLLSLARSLRPNISRCHTLRLWLSCSVYLSISLSAGLSLSLIPPLLRCALSPTLPLAFSLPSCICLFRCCTSLGFLSPTDAVCLCLCSFSTRLPLLCLLSLCLLLCILLSVSLSPSPPVSPDIHVELFSHVRYRFTTPARSPWPLNLIPSTKPHCFFVCLGLSVVCDCG